MAKLKIKSGKNQEKRSLFGIGNLRPLTKFSFIEIYFLILFAILIDGINWLPLMNFVSLAFFLPTFLLYFTLRGAKPFSFIGSSVLDLISSLTPLPFLPLFTLGVIIIIVRHNFRVAKRAKKGAVETIIAEPELANE